MTIEQLLLHAEDNATWRNIFSDEAQFNGWRYLGCDTAAAAIAILAEQVPHAVITDLHLKIGSGYDVARAAAAAGVAHIVIASETPPPSETVPGVKIMDKQGAASWLAAIMAGEELQA